MKSFGEFFPEKAYDELNTLTHPKYGEYFDQTLVPAFAAFFAELMTAGKVSPVSSQGYELQFIDSWNKVIEGNSENFYIAQIAWKVIHKWIFCTTGYDAFIQAVDTGELLWMEYENCGKSGIPVGFQLHNWVPVLQNLKGDPIEPLAPIPVINKLEVNFPTGNLLAADWFRIKEFTDALKDSDRISINYEVGRIKATKFYASHGVVSVFVGNSSPYIWQKDDNIIVGRDPWDFQEIDGLFVGSICTDLWWATFIDRSRLEEMVGAEKVANMLNDQDIVQFTVQPGIYTLQFSAHPDTFSQNYDGGLCTGLDNFFVLTSN